MSGIEDGKTASDIFGGCAPIQWLKDVGVGITSAIGRSIFDAGQFIGDWWRGFQEDWISAIPIIGEAFSEGLQITDRITRPILDLARVGLGASFGSVIYVGRMVRDSLRDNPCAKAIAAALAGGTALFGGWLAAKALFATGIGSRIAMRIATAVGLGKIIRGFVVSTMRIYNFNWQVTDCQIRQQQAAAFQSLMGTAGDAVGTALGNLLCGGTVGASVAVFNPRVAAQIWEVAGEEIKEEIISNYWNLLQATWRTAAQIGFLEIYSNTRKLVKAAARNPVVKTLLPDKWENLIETWGDEGQKPWSFAQAVEEKIESIQNTNLRAFMENFVESFLDGCWDSLVTVSYAV